MNAIAGFPIKLKRKNVNQGFIIGKTRQVLAIRFTHQDRKVDSLGSWIESGNIPMSDTNVSACVKECMGSHCIVLMAFDEYNSRSINFTVLRASDDGLTK